MPSTTCNACGADIEYDLLEPFTIINDPATGKQAIAMNWAPIYEHMKDLHPELWGEDIAAEYAAFQANPLGPANHV